MKERSKKRLGELLIERGVLSRENLVEALDYQKKNGGIIGQILIRLGYISEENLAGALGGQLKVPYLPLPHYSINTEAAQRLDEEFCRRNVLMAFDDDDKHIYIVAGDPLNEAAIEDIETKSQLRPQVFISTPTEIFNMLDLAFSAVSKKEVKKAG